MSDFLREHAGGHDGSHLCEKLHIKLQETVYRPGFYRVALAVN